MAQRAAASRTTGHVGSTSAVVAGRPRLTFDSVAHVSHATGEDAAMSDDELEVVLDATDVPATSAYVVGLLCCGSN
jgi:hypothetical protein